MKKYKTLKLIPDKKLSYYKKLCRWRRSMQFKCIIVSALGLFICICVLNNVKWINQMNKTNQNSHFRSLESKTLHETANVLDQQIRYHVTGIKNVRVFSKTHDKVGESQKAGHKHKQNGVNESNEMERRKRYLSNGRGAEESPQLRVENSNKVSTLNFSTAEKFYAAAIKCQEYQHNCTLDCLNGSVSFLDENISDFKPMCPNVDLSLMLRKCEFNFGILQQSFFYSASAMTLLAINECNLQTIKANAFQHSNVKNLHTLILVNNQLVTLQDSTFDGLTKLVRFEFVQNPLSTSFKGERFLKPLAASLQEAVLQPQVNATEVSDPLSWWRDSEMSSVTELDLSHTNLQGVLSPATFQTFVKLKVLRLCACNLLSVEGNFFGFITYEFRYLDLQANYLKTLDSGFLQKMAIPGLEMNLSFNDWFCECEGEMFAYFALNNVSLSPELRCSGPEKWKNMMVKRALEECGRAAISTTKFITSGTTNSLPPSTTEYTVATSFRNSSSAQSNISTETTTKEPNTVEIPPSSTSTTSSTEAFPPQSLIPIECFMDDDRTTTFWRHILKPKIDFSVNIVSAARLMITLNATNILPHFVIAYFTSYKNYYYITDLKEENYIEALEPSTAYVICLIVEPILTVSPFGCQAYFVDGTGSQRRWLLEQDKTWFISLISTITILLFLASVLIAYKLLRRKPQWLLKRNRNRPHVNYSSGKTLVTTRSAGGGQSLHSSPESDNSVQYLNSRPSLVKASRNDEQTVIYYSQYAVPWTRAPPVPPTEKFCRKAGNATCSTGQNRTTACRNNSPTNGDYLDIIENDPDYQTIDY